MQVQVRVEYDYGDAFTEAMLLAAKEWQRYEVISSERDGDPARSSSPFRNLLGRLEGVVTRIDDAEAFRDVGKVQLGADPSIVLQRIDHAGMPDRVGPSRVAFRSSRSSSAVR